MDEYNKWTPDGPDWPGETDNIRILDRWFSSDAYKEVINDACKGDKDSIALMDKIDVQLQTLHFHMNNDSHIARVDYEIRRFADLVSDLMD